MGLIDRAIGDIEDDLIFSEAVEEPSNDSRLFDINLTRLHNQGVYSPDHEDSNQTLELRAVKRRLLRRVGFLQRIGRDARAVRQTGRQRNVIVVTSTRPGEGKTFSAVNLAISLAFEDNQRVLLIDGDAPRPRVRSYFDLPQGPGLTDRILDPTISMADVVWKARQAPLTIMSEGSPVDNATSLFASAAAKKFFIEQSARQPDRLVIVDAPPMLATTESIALARHADEVIFVVQADATPESAAATALDELLEINPNVSLLLNRCLIPAGGTHYGSYHQYERARASDNSAGAVARRKGN